MRMLTAARVFRRTADCLGLAAAALVLDLPAAAEPRLSPALQVIRADPAAAAAYPCVIRPSAYHPQGAGASETAVRVFLRLAPGADGRALAARHPAAVLRSRSGPVVTAAAPISALEALASDPDVLYVEGSERLRPALDVARSSAMSAGLHLGVVDQFSADFGVDPGSGVVVGLVDTGIDFRHPDFIREGLPDRTRVLRIWDQTDSGGPAPAAPFGYGTEWLQAQLDDELDGSPAGVVRASDTEGHGTSVASAAAGDGSATGNGQPAGAYVGLAPAAGLVVVRTTFDNADILDGINYVAAVARSLGLRAVVNLSLAGQDSPHDGTGSFDQGVDAVAASTPVVAAMGNDYTRALHASAVVAPSGSATISAQRQTVTDILRFDFWAQAGDAYTCEVATHSSLATTLSAASGASASGVLGGASISIANGTNSHPAGDKEIFISITQSPQVAPANFYFRFTRTANGSTGRLDGYVWDTLDAKFTSDVDQAGTVASPAVAPNVISVGSYCSKRQWLDVDGVSRTETDCPAPSLGDVSSFSSRGPTRDGRVKPDVAAPGNRVATALSADQAPAPANSDTSRDGRHVLVRGTSVASPVVAGIVALKLQRDGSLTPAAIKAELAAQAAQDAAVLGAGAVPNNAFGHGKAHVLACGGPVTSTPTAASALTLGVSSISFAWTATAGATSYRVYYATNPASLIASPAGPAFTFAGLFANTTYGVLVAGANACGPGPAQASASTSTLAQQAASSWVQAAHQSSVTVSYAALAAAPREASCFGYRLEASTDPAFGGPVLSSSTANPALAGLAVQGLSAYTTYHLRLGTLNEPGGANYSAALTTMTATTLEPPVAAAFADVSSGSLTAGWTLGNNPAGLQYLAQLSTSADFTGAVLDAASSGLAAGFSGLSPDTTYHARVKASTGPFASLGSTVTLALAPAGPAFAVYLSSLAVAWDANGNGSSTLYLARVSSSPGFAWTVLSSATYATSALFTGLDSNSTYTLRLAALNKAGTPTSDVTSAASTLAQPPGSPAQPFVSVTSSITVRWTPLPASPSSASCSGYRVDAATSAGFTGTLVTEAVWDASASTLGVAGLDFGATYYLRVGSLNHAGSPNYVVLGSTAVADRVLSSAPVSGAGATVTVDAPPVPQLTRIQVDVPPGALPAGTVLTVNASVGSLMPAPRSSQGRMTPLGPGVAVEVSAGGAQPAAPVAIAVTYDPARLPAGADPRTMVMARYSDADGQWTLLPTTVDTANRTVTGLTRHLSLFAPFFMAAGPDLSSIQVFPVPWMPGSGDPDFDAQALTFANLPAGASVRLRTILGEDVWDGAAGPAGTLTWDGRARNGSRAASGTYFAVIKANGSALARRVVIVR